VVQSYRDYFYLNFFNVKVFFFYITKGSRKQRQQTQQLIIMATIPTPKKFFTQRKIIFFVKLFSVFCLNMFIRVLDLFERLSYSFELSFSKLHASSHSLCLFNVIFFGHFVNEHTG
jgi:hypothetical protein